MVIIMAVCLLHAGEQNYVRVCVCARVLRVSEALWEYMNKHVYP